MSFIKYALGVLAVAAGSILVLSNSGFFGRSESYYLFMAHRFRYDIAFVILILFLIFFSNDIGRALSRFLETRSRGTRIAYLIVAAFFLLGTTWLVRYDLFRYVRERGLYFEKEFARDYSRFLTLVGDQYHFDGQFADATRLWTLAGGERNSEKVRITAERRALAAKIFASSLETERHLGPNVGTYFATMQAIYLYPESEEYLDKINWYIAELKRESSIPCNKISEKDYWVYYGRYYNLKPICAGIDHRKKWYLSKLIHDLDVMKMRRTDGDTLFEMLARSEADTLSNKGHSIIASSFPSRIYSRFRDYDGKQDFVEAGGDDDQSAEAEESSDVIDTLEDNSEEEVTVEEASFTKPEEPTNETAAEDEREVVAVVEDNDGVPSPHGIKEAASDRSDASNVENILHRPTSDAGFQWPVEGRLLAAYGSNDLESGTTNDGIDIDVAEGTVVVAAASGVVIYAGDGLKEYGDTAVLRHNNGIVTVYAHNKSLMVHRGQEVKRGEPIAVSGLNGTAGIPMLYFEMREDSAPFDPLLYLPKLETR